jgi:hypothetical protein
MLLRPAFKKPLIKCSASAAAFVSSNMVAPSYGALRDAADDRCVILSNAFIRGLHAG